MEEQSLRGLPTLSPHKYPLGIKIFALAIILAVSYSLFLLPKYFSAAQKFRQAEASYQETFYSGDNTRAIDLYIEVLKAVPDSKNARIGAAEAIFSGTSRS